MQSQLQMLGPVPQRSAVSRPELKLVRGSDVILRRHTDSPLLEVHRGDEETAKVESATVLKSLFATLGIDIVEFAIRQKSGDVIVDLIDGNKNPTEAQRQRMNLLYDATNKIVGKYGRKAGFAFWWHGHEFFQEPPLYVVANSADIASARRIVMAMASDEVTLGKISRMINPQV